MERWMEKSNACLPKGLLGTHSLWTWLLCAFHVRESSSLIMGSLEVGLPAVAMLVFRAALRSQESLHWHSWMQEGLEHTQESVPEHAWAPLEAPLAQAGTYRQDMEHAVPTGCWELLHCARGVNMVFVKDTRGCSTKEKILEYCGAAFPAQRVQTGLIHLPWLWKYWANFFKMTHLLNVNLRGQITKMSSKLKIPLGILQW